MQFMDKPGFAPGFFFFEAPKMAVVARITGIDQLRANFLSFPKQLAVQGLKKAVMKGAAPIRAAAIALAPRGVTGRLKAAVSMAQDKRPQLAGMDARAVVFVQWKGARAALYWRHVEFGTSHMAAKPFLRPALENQKTAALTIIVQTLVDAVPRIAATLRK